MATYWYGYHYYDDTGKRHSGITTDPERRQNGHQQSSLRGRLTVVVGPTARAWEALQTKTITPAAPIGDRDSRACSAVRGRC